MSELKICIEIAQPDGMRGNDKGEVIKCPPQRCIVCNGAGGWHIDSRSFSYDPDVGEHYQTCRVCKGSGSVAAQILIGWQTIGEIKKQYLNTEKQ